MSALFTTPWLLWTLVVPLAVAGRLMRARRRVAGYTAPCAELFNVPGTWRQRLRGVPGALRLLALVLLCVALAGPRVLLHRKAVVPRDIAILLDVSGSMLAEDVQPSRLAAAKQFAQGLVEHLPSDRFAVVTFGGEAITDCPLTIDHDAVREALRAADYRPTEEGTALGRGLAAAIRTLRTGDGRRKAVILLSDGAENAGELLPATAASLAPAYGIVVDAIGFGSRGHPVPYPTPYGVLDVRLDLDEPALRALSAAGGGRYWRHGEETTAVRVIDEQLVAAGSELKAYVSADPVDVAPFCMLVAVACLIAETTFRSRLLRMYA